MGQEVTYKQWLYLLDMRYVAQESIFFASIKKASQDSGGKQM